MSWPPGGTLPVGWTYEQYGAGGAPLSLPAVSIDPDVGFAGDSPSVKLALSDPAARFILVHLGPLTVSTATPVSLKTKSVDLESVRVSTELLVLASPAAFDGSWYESDTVVSAGGGWDEHSVTVPPGTWHLAVIVWRQGFDGWLDYPAWVDDPVGFAAASGVVSLSVSWPVDVVAAPRVACPWPVDVVALAALATAWPVAVLHDDAKWQRVPLPAGYEVLDYHVQVLAGRCFVKTKQGPWLFYSDGPDWVVSTPPFGFESFGAAWGADGQWWLAGRDAGSAALRFARSVDGAAAQVWQVIVPASGAEYELYALAVTAAGRLVSAGANGIATSDDGGINWSLRVTAEFDSFFAQVRDWGNGVLSAVGAKDLCVSLDGGTTWHVSTPGPGVYRTRSCAYMGPGPGARWVVSLAANLTVLFGDPVSGVWTQYAAGQAGRHQLDARAGCFYSLEAVGDALGLRTLGAPFTAGAVLDARPIAAAGGVNSYRDAFSVQGGRIAFWSPSVPRGDALLVYPLGAEAVELVAAWPVEVVAPVYVRGQWPVAVAARPAAYVTTAWPATVSVPRMLSAPWPVWLMSTSVVGGLDGAGAWAAAPSGKWEAIVTLDGVDISARLSGDCSVLIAASAARLADFSFLPAGPVAVMGLVGRPVTLAFAQAGRLAVQPLFAGVVDVPSIDLATGVVSCRCTDQAQEVWSGMPREAIAQLVGGRWHVAVSGEPADNFDYLEARLQSVGASWALDVQRQPRVLSWRSPVRTLTVREGDVIDGSVSVDLPSRDQLRTRVECRLQYRYTVLRYRGASAQYSQPIEFFMPRVAVGAIPGYTAKTMLTTAMVEGAAASLPGWDLQSLVVEHPPAREWNLGSPLRPLIYYIRAAVAPELALGFTAKYAARWQQSITEDYHLTVSAPLLEQQLGSAVPDELVATLEAPFEQRDWGSDASVEPVFGSGTGDAAVAWQPDGADGVARDEALRTLLDQAWVRLWGASRSGRVQFALPCRPDLWLDVRVVLEHSRVRAAGDVVELEHSLSAATGAATTSVTLAVGMPGDAPALHPQWALPTPPVDGYAPPLAAYSCAIGTYVGGAPSSLPWDEQTMVGFSTNHQEDFSNVAEHPRYPHQLRIKAPDLAAEDRDPRDLVAAAAVEVAIPTDLLEIL